MKPSDPAGQPAGAAASGSAEEVGDPACWLALVCPACGRLADRRDAEACQSCGADLPERDVQ